MSSVFVHVLGVPLEETALQLLPLGASPSTVNVSLAPEAEKVTNSLVTDTPYEAPAVYLVVDGIEMDRHPGVVYSVYLNHPEADESTGHYNEHFAGFLTFFGVELGEGNGDGGHAGHEGHDHGPPARKYDVTGIVRYQQEAGTWDPSQVSVTFVPTGLETPDGDQAPGGHGSEPDEANVRLGEVKLLYGG